MGKRKQIDKIALANAYKRDYKIKDASKAAGVSDGCARTTLINMGLYLTPSEAKAKRNAKLKDKLIKFCGGEKKPIKEIAEFLGLTVSNAKINMKNLELDYLVKNVITEKQKETERRIELLRTMPDLTVNEMVEKTGIPANSIRTLISKYGLEYKEEKNFSGETLCWKCKNYTKCSWYKTFTPVEGWEAEKTKLKISENHYVDSYKVISCPMFEQTIKAPQATDNSVEDTKK